MAEDGLHVRWTSIRASDVGAPHHRERLFILAAPADTEGERFSGQQQSSRGVKAIAGVNSRFGAFPHTYGERRDGRGATPEQEGRAHAPADRQSAGVDWGPYAAAVRRWGRLTRPAPAPTEPNTKGNPRLSAAFAEWMMGLPEGHVTQVPSMSRADQLKAIGNGVCPQQAAAALTTLLEMDNI